MSNKQKGSTAEREIVHLFWANGWAATRVAGSGSMKYPSPDIIAHKEGLQLAIECKKTKQTSKYFENEEIADLQTYAQISGARPLIAIKFPKQEWLFLLLLDFLFPSV